jgi:hypothetical protein
MLEKSAVLEICNWYETAPTEAFHAKLGPNGTFVAPSKGDIRLGGIRPALMVKFWPLTAYSAAFALSDAFTLHIVDGFDGTVHEKLPASAGVPAVINDHVTPLSVDNSSFIVRILGAFHLICLIEPITQFSPPLGARSKVESCAGSVTVKKMESPAELPTLEIVIPPSTLLFR